MHQAKLCGVTNPPPVSDGTRVRVSLDGSWLSDASTRMDRGGPPVPATGPIGGSTRGVPRGVSHRGIMKFDLFVFMDSVGYRMLWLRSFESTLIPMLFICFIACPGLEGSGCEVVNLREVSVLLICLVVFFQPRMF